MQINWDAVAKTGRQAIAAGGEQATFTLSGTPALTVPATYGRLTADDLTAGINQNSYRLRVHADDWSAAAPRDPRKGDLVEFRGRKSALEAVWTRSTKGRDHVFVLVVRG